MYLGSVCGAFRDAANCTSWAARLLILELPKLERIVGGPEPLVTDLYSFSRPLVRDERLAQRFVELHRAFETPSWALERETLLADWLHDVSDGHLDDHRRSARRDSALRRACDVSLYTLRHSHASACHYAGLTIPEAARRLGHGPGLHVETYAHVIDRMTGTRHDDLDQLIRAARAELEFPAGSPTVDRLAP